jgi:Eukaryotic initiation factor 4E
MPKGLASRYWEEVILALIGGQFGNSVVDHEICGAVLSMRYNEDILGVWNRNANATTEIEKIRTTIQRILQLPPNAYMEYKPHETSLQDRGGANTNTGTSSTNTTNSTTGTSFRNNHNHATTQAWKPKVDRNTNEGSVTTSLPTLSTMSTSATSTTTNTSSSGTTQQSSTSSVPSSSRRSGSWTERDKTLNTKPLTRGSWRS